MLSVGKIIYSDIWITQWGDVSMLGAVNYITPNINNQSWTLALSGFDFEDYISSVIEYALTPYFSRRLKFLGYA